MGCLHLAKSIKLSPAGSTTYLFIGPESDHWECLSLTDSCLVNLIDVNLACEDDNSKLVEVVNVPHVDDQKRVDNSLLQIWKLKFGHKAKVFVQTLSTRFQGLVKILKLKFGHYFAADAWLWLCSSILVEILKLGLIKIFKLKFCLVEILKLMLGRDSEDV